MDESLYDTGHKLELFTNACFQTLGYYIDTNLKVIENKVNNPGQVDILEIDIYAKIFKNISIETTLVECKRGATFNDLFKFSGVSQLIKANKNIMVVVSKQTDDIIPQAEKINLKIIEPVELYEQISAEYRNIFSMFYAWNEVKYFIISKDYIRLCMNQSNTFSNNQEEAYNEFKSCLALINGKVWREPSLLERAKSLSNLLIEKKDFVRHIARIQKIKPSNKSSQYYIDRNEICQATGALVIDIKLAYIVCAVECAILKIDTGKLKDTKFINLVNKLSSNIKVAVLIPKFLQYLINIFGGIYFNDKEDINNLCSIMKITINDFHDIVSLLKELFTIPNIGIQWGFEENLLVVNLKYTPSVYKAIGIENRNRLGFNTEIFVERDFWLKKIKSWRSKNESN